VKENIMLSITGIPRNRQPNKLKQGSELVLQHTANVGTVHYSGGAAPCLLVGVIFHV